MSEINHRWPLIEMRTAVPVDRGFAEISIIVDVDALNDSGELGKYLAQRFTVAVSKVTSGAVAEEYGELFRKWTGL